MTNRLEREVHESIVEENGELKHSLEQATVMMCEMVTKNDSLKREVRSLKRKLKKYEVQVVRD